MFTKSMGKGEAKEGKGTAKGEGKETAGGKKGASLGDTLEKGVGYTTSDKHSKMKNVQERSNVNLFLQEMKDPEAKKAVQEAVQQGEAEEASGKETEAVEPKEAKETKETKEQREEGEKGIRQREEGDEARVQGQKQAEEAQEKKNAKETTEADDAQQQQQQEQEDEEDKPGAGWVQEELEEEAQKKKDPLGADVMGAEHRCKGTLEDGSRCLRHPVDGMPYCREHAVSVPELEAPPAPVEASEATEPAEESASELPDQAAIEVE